MAGRGKKIDELETSKIWKFLLYPDNAVHRSVIDRLLAGDVEGYGGRSPSWLGIEHYMYNASGEKITEGQGKLHWHFAFKMSSEISNSALCARLGLFRDTGEPDLAFVRPVSFPRGRRSIDGESQWLLYLTHITEPWKNQYDFSDLKGSQDYLDLYRRAVLTWQRQTISIEDGLRAVINWIKRQDGYITASQFASFLLGSPYLRFRSDKLVLAVLYEHNTKIEDQMRVENENLISKGYQARASIDSMSRSSALLCSGGSSCDSIQVDSLDEFEELQFPIF